MKRWGCHAYLVLRVLSWLLVGLKSVVTFLNVYNGIHCRSGCFNIADHDPMDIMKNINR